MSFEVLSPVPYQILQQDATGQAVVRVCLRSGELAAGQIQFAVSGERRGQSTDWLELPPADESGTYQADVTLAAGGWYGLWFRADADTEPECVVPYVGVGEVFVVAGQSNAANHGEVPLRAQDDRVAAYGDGAWRPAYDPLPGASGFGGSPWSHLGDLLVRQLQVPIGFASVAVGGTDSAFWLPGAEGYELLVRVVRELGAEGFRSVLWHQGETDTAAGTTPQQYHDNLCTIIRQLREDAGCSAPWMVAGVSFRPDGQGQPHPMAGQQMLWREGMALEGPYTDDMLGDVFRYDLLHFSEYGLRAHAERWFAMLWAQFYAKVPLVLPQE